MLATGVNYDTGLSWRGGIGWTIVDRLVDPPAIKGEFERGEEALVTYLKELVEDFDRIELAAALWFSFAGLAELNATQMEN
ncbi:hypothetical protein F1D05_32635 [Kribbella qitaiheensis]|uniref:Uncharacterized protein n=1 Tax=Kribbella qitaiheensis TaxID=1544730 RepID=A0A7G6X6D4_9ACTN|nr:hypothetical protein [Kribbella qitaiheensis]QNE21799.1 hypothetical protein F1D05_32635 [Kribbella qitaiheensis]